MLLHMFSRHRCFSQCQRLQPRTGLGLQGQERGSLCCINNPTPLLYCLRPGAHKPSDGLWTHFQGHADAIEFLICKGVRLDVLDNYGRSGLWLAASHGFAECVRALLRNGLRPLLDTPANCGPTETRGRTPLLIAAMRGHTEVRPDAVLLTTPLELLPAGKEVQGHSAHGG